MSTTPSKSRPRLGRGLGSLINLSEFPIEAEIPATPPSVTEPRSLSPEASPGPLVPVSPAPLVSTSAPPTIPLSQISPNPHQPRRSFDETSLSELAASLKSTGLIQPIIVRRTSDGYQLISGERRLRAAKLAGLSDIPAIIRDVDSLTQAQMALVENIQRQDLNPIDRAQGYRQLLSQLGLTQAELSTRLGEDRSSVANYLRLLELPSEVQAMIGDDRLSLGHAKLLAGVSDILEQQRLAELVVSQALSVRNLERLIQQSRPAAKPRANPTPSAHIQDLEQSISRQLGMRVQLHSAGKKGRLTIHYATLDEFDTLLTRLNVHTE